MSQCSQIGATNSAVIFFRKLLNPSDCIHHLLPPPRDTEITSRLRKATMYPRPRKRTNCYKSFIHHTLIKYQYAHITLLGYTTESESESDMSQG